MTAPVLPPGIETLPPWVQVSVTIFVFGVALFISFRSIVKPTNVEKTKDVVVPGVSIMDGEIFRNAAEQLKSQARMQEHRDAQLRELQRELQAQTDLLREGRDAMRNVVEHLESIERKLRQELRRQAEGRNEA